MLSIDEPRSNVAVVGAGQSGLAAARAVRDAGLRPIVLEARPRPEGSWHDYYDSLRLFSPAEYSALYGVPFPGDPDAYPSRDDVARYLNRFADDLGVEIRTSTRVIDVRTDGDGFVLDTDDGDEIPAAGVVAASGSFGNPYRPSLPGQAEFIGEVLHVANYRNPAPYEGKRVIVVGGGNSGVQVAFELSAAATVTLATHEPVQFLAARPSGHDMHYWLDKLGFDDLPPHWLQQFVTGPLVVDYGDYEPAMREGRFDRKPMFERLDGDAVVWTDGSREPVDAIVLATGYRPDLPYLADLGALDADGLPRHVGGASLTHPGLVYLGLEFQRSFASNTLRGVARDAQHVVGPLAAVVRNARAVVGLS